MSSSDDLVELQRLISDPAETDFAFEMQCLASVKSAGFSCSHGGTYDDPVTGKQRQFDIVAHRRAENRLVCLFVEAKRLVSSQVVVHTVPRDEASAWHELFGPYDQRNAATGALRRVAVPDKNGKTFAFRTQGTGRYRIGEQVGKAVNVALRKKDSGFVLEGDKDIYERWSQAVSSLFSSIGRTVGPETQVWCAAVPILVVPDNTLWVLPYDVNGRGKNLEAASSVPFYLGSRMRVDLVGHFPPYSTVEFGLSHLEIVTFSALRALCEDLISENGGLFLTPN